MIGWRLCMQIDRGKQTEGRPLALMETVVGCFATAATADMQRTDRGVQDDPMDSDGAEE